MYYLCWTLKNGKKKTTYYPLSNNFRNSCDRSNIMAQSVKALAPGLSSALRPSFDPRPLPDTFVGCVQLAEFS